ncbi:hypothetical protein PG996_001467 [Apiospora saccharicola]|uniref:Carbohydrate-binding module family 19 domain-containing protein n=1 Tax=Apiospora saccharicola TaxID=335842 RepID=A0ABR1WJK6_9PEZI
MASNLAEAQKYNSLFGGLKEDNACMAGQIACVNDNIGQCGNSGAFSITPCIGNTKCFALPMNTTTGVQVGCYDPNVAGRILGDSKSAPSATTSQVNSPAPSATVTASQANSGQPSEVTVTVFPTEVVTSIIVVPPKETPGTTTVTEAPSTTLLTMTRSSTSPPPAVLTTIVVIPPILPPIVSSASAPSSIPPPPPPPAPVPSSTSESKPPQPSSTLASLVIIPITRSHHGHLGPIPTDIPVHSTAKVIANPAVGGPVTVTVKETETVTTTTTTTDQATVTATVSA